MNARIDNIVDVLMWTGALAIDDILKASLIRARLQRLSNGTIIQKIAAYANTAI
jgi:hypothetical protein